MGAEEDPAAKTLGDARAGAPQPLADFGPRSWPRDHVAAFSPPPHLGQSGLQEVMVELAWRLVVHVAVCVVGQSLCCQIAVQYWAPCVSRPQ